MLPEAQKLSLELPWLPTEYCFPHDPISSPLQTLTSLSRSTLSSSLPSLPSTLSSSPWKLELPVQLSLWKSNLSAGRSGQNPTTFPLSAEEKSCRTLPSVFLVWGVSLDSGSHLTEVRVHVLFREIAGLLDCVMADQAVILKCLEKLKLHEQVSCRAAFSLQRVVLRDAGF